MLQNTDALQGCDFKDEHSPSELLFLVEILLIWGQNWQIYDGEKSYLQSYGLLCIQVFGFCGHITLQDNTPRQQEV